MDLLTNKVVKESIHVRIYDGPPWRYLTPDVLNACETLWDQAQSAVAKEPDTLLRVRIARFSLDYAQLMTALARAQNQKLDVAKLAADDPSWPRGFGASARWASWRALPRLPRLAVHRGCGPAFGVDQPETSK